MIVFKKVDHTHHVAEGAKREVMEDTTTEDEEDTNSEVIFARKAVDPLSEVQDEFCPNVSFENKSTSTLSYSAAVAPLRKLGGVDYYSLKYDSDSERSTEGGSVLSC